MGSTQVPANFTLILFPGFLPYPRRFFESWGLSSYMIKKAHGEKGPVLHVSVLCYDTPGAIWNSSSLSSYLSVEGTLGLHSTVISSKDSLQDKIDLLYGKWSVLLLLREGLHVLDVLG